MQILNGTPSWVWLLLILLVFLGARRLRTREMPVFAAVLPAIAFLIWSLVGVVQFGAAVGLVVAIATWLAGAAVGGLVTLLAPEARGQRLAGGKVRIPGSRVPLILYLGVFVARFTCAVWAAIVPPQAHLATGIGIAIGAAMTARLVIGVARWQPPNL